MALCAGHVNSKHCLFASFGTTDLKGKWIISGSEDHSIHIWHLNTRAVSTCQSLRNTHAHADPAVCIHNGTHCIVVYDVT